MVKFTAEVDDLHVGSFPEFQFFLRHCEEQRDDAIQMALRGEHGLLRWRSQ
jgi:hypothetical protein